MQLIFYDYLIIQIFGFKFSQLSQQIKADPTRRALAISFWPLALLFFSNMVFGYFIFLDKFVIIFVWMYLLFLFLYFLFNPWVGALSPPRAPKAAQATWGWLPALFSPNTLQCLTPALSKITWGKKAKSLKFPKCKQWKDTVQKNSLRNIIWESKRTPKSK